MHRAKEGEVKMIQKNSASVMKNAYITFYLGPIQSLDMRSCAVIIPRPPPRPEYSYNAMHFPSHVFFSLREALLLIS